MHSDSVLLTGMNSHSVGKLERSLEKERLKKEKKLHVKAKVAPAIEPIIEELNKEINTTILAQLDLVDSTTEAGFKATALALKMYKESCQNLKNKLSKIMRAEP